MKTESCKYSNIFNVVEYLLNSSGYIPVIEDRVALRYREQIITYNDIRRYVYNYGGYFLHCGLKRGDRLAILLPDQPQYVYAFLGAILVGVVPVLINTRLSLANIKYILDDSGASMLVSTSGWKQKLEGIYLHKGIFTIDSNPPYGGSHTVHDEYCSEGLPIKVETTKDDLAFLLYTSGSSGPPKGVMHLQRDMLICADLYGKNVLNLSSGDVLYSASRLGFAYGLGSSIFLPFYVAASSILSYDDGVFAIMETINRYKPTVFFAVPTIYALLLKLSTDMDIDTSCLRLCVSAGEVLPKAIWEEWRRKFGIEILEGFGTTEMLHVFLSNTPSMIKPGSVGTVVPGYSVKIVDDDGRDVKPGRVGNLLVSGDSQMAGYWNKDELTQNTMVGSMIRTGDKVWWDTDGFVWYVGRSTDCFKINGEWVNAYEIENILLGHSCIDEVVVYSEFSDGQLAHVVASVKLNSSCTPSEDLTLDIIKFTKQRLAHFKCPKRIVYVNEVPKGPTGKVDRKKIIGDYGGTKRHEGQVDLIKD